MGPDLFVFANVVLSPVLGSHQRPYLRDLFFTYVKHSCPFRCVDPFVKRRPKIIAVKIVALEIELRERMRTVDYGLDAASTRHLTNLFYGIDLPCEVDLM